jgi:hypothetical protein
MTHEQLTPPPQGSYPVEAILPPQVGTSLLLDSALPATSQQVGTTMLIDSALPQLPTTQVGTSILMDAVFPTVSSSQVSILNESVLASGLTPQIGTTLPLEPKL